jgi:hypothetical protein
MAYLARPVPDDINAHLATISAIVQGMGDREHDMANLLVRGIDDALVQRLREQAAAHGRSAEAEHREILD